jgi:hypothetical protein
MASQAGKLAPLVLTVAGAGYCVWPYVQPQAPPAPPKGDMPKIEASWLNPKFPPASSRNLFQPVLPKADIAAAKKAELAKKAEIEAKLKQESASLLDGWTLGATMVHPARPGAAVVNGKVYLEGETVPPPRSDGEHLSLLRVERDRVVMRRAKHTDEVILVFSPAKKSAGSGKAADPRAPGARKAVSILERMMAAMDGSAAKPNTALNRPPDSTANKDPQADGADTPGAANPANPGEGGQS